MKKEDRIYCSVREHQSSTTIGYMECIVTGLGSALDKVLVFVYIFWD